MRPPKFLRRSDSRAVAEPDELVVLADDNKHALLMQRCRELFEENQKLRASVDFKHLVELATERNRLREERDALRKQLDELRANTKRQRALL